MTELQYCPEPPEELLDDPSLNQEASTWVVVARNRRVNNDWKVLVQRNPENAKRCYHHLSTQPLTRYPGRIFPLRGKKYSGAWEYEVSSGDRVFYVPDQKQQKVVVYYAGEHPKKAAPFPP